MDKNCLFRVITFNKNRAKIFIFQNVFQKAVLSFLFNKIKQILTTKW